MNAHQRPDRHSMGARRCAPSTNRSWLARLGTITLASLLIAACGGGGGGSDDGDDGPIHVPPDSSEQWTLVPAASVGMDGALLAQAVSTLPAESVHGLASMIVMRHGQPVLEQYWNGYDKDTLHDLRSATKTITSLMVGIAIDQKVLDGVDEPLAKHLSAAYPTAPVLQQGLVLEDLLTMRSGLACDDWTASSPGNETKMYQHADWVGFYLGLPSVAAGGVKTQYCTGNPVTLGRVIVEAGHTAIPTFAGTNLFTPLGIRHAQWASFDNDHQTDTGGHIQLRPRDMTKLGQLALQRGNWGGHQVVSSDWIDRSTSLHTHFTTFLGDTRNGYGYLWWRSTERYAGHTAEMFFANGNGGQYIFVIPSLDLVVVFTGENYNSDAQNRPFEILDTYVLPAVVG